MGELVDTAETGEELKHDQEVMRLLDKMSFNRRISIALLFPVCGLGLLGLYLTSGVESMVLIGGILGTSLLVAFSVFVILQQKTQSWLKASLGTQPPVAFHSLDGGYVFISQEGVFAESAFWFVPFQGFTRVTGMDFDPVKHQLTIRIQNAGRGQNRSELIIDVPTDFPGEPLERLSAAFRDGDLRSALVR
jgi:hypothetical protein